MEFRSLVDAPPALTPSEEVVGRPLGGFDFSFTERNNALVRSVPGSHLPRAMKTGTTICGTIFKNGVVLGADTRATEDTVISDKNCEKIHYIAPNIKCCGAGTAADTENITGVIASSLELLRRSTGRDTRVVTAMTMLKRRLFQYQGHISAALVLGGVDVTGPHLYTVYPHGSTDKLPFVSMGSGSLAAMAVLESGFKDDLEEADAVELVAAAIRAGIFNDLGSGSNVDVCIIRAPTEGRKGVDVDYRRNMEMPNAVAPLRALFTRPAGRSLPIGATVVLRESFEPAAGTAPGAKKHMLADAPASAAAVVGGVPESKMDLE